MSGFPASLPASLRLAPAPFHAAASLTAEQVDVWRIDLAALQPFQTALAALLQASDAALPQPRLLARGGLHLLLGAYLQCPPEAIRLRPGRHGKPSLTASPAANRRDIRFNLAHGGAVALLAVAQAADVGIDVETLRPVPHCLKIARRYFPADQGRRLAGLAAGQERDECFLRLWCRHEAAAKATGLGVFRTPQPAASAPPPRLQILDLSWRQHDRQYLAALAVHDGARQPRHWRLP